MSRNVPLIRARVAIPGFDRLVNMSDRVLSMKYEDCDAKADKITLIVDNDDLDQFDLPIWRTGNVLYLAWGYPEVMSVERTTIIKKVSGFRQLTIEALGGEILANRVKQTWAYEKKTYSAIALLIANDLGFFEDRVIHIEPTTEEKPVVNQTGETDAMFLRRISELVGMKWYIDWDGFHFHSDGWAQEGEDGGRGRKVLTYYSDQSPTEILDIKIEVDVTRKPQIVTAKSHNPKDNHGIDFTAYARTDAQRTALAERLEATGEGEWRVPGKEGEAVYGKPAKGAPHDVKTSSAKTADGIAQDALTEMRKNKMATVDMTITVVGDPTIFAKSIIDLRGVGLRLSQLYYVSSVTHSIGNGYTCTLECQSDGSHGHSTKSGYLEGFGGIALQPANPGKKGFIKESAGIDKMIVDPKTGKKRAMTAEEIKGLEQQRQREQTPKDPKTGKPANMSTTSRDVDLKAPKEVRIFDAVTTGAGDFYRPDVIDPSKPLTVDRAVAPPIDAGTAAALKELEDKAYVGSATEAELLRAYVNANPDYPDLPEEPVVRPNFYENAAVPGNLDLDHRPSVPVPGAEGMFATVRTMGFQEEEGGLEINIPTVSHDGRLLTANEAIDYYHETGEHMGMYRTVEEAERAAIAIHEDQQRQPPIDTLKPVANRRLTREQFKQLLQQDIKK